MNQYTLDASVGAKWLFDEELSEKAVLLLQELKQNKIEIIVPELFYVELGSICWSKVKRKQSALEYAVEGLDKILGFTLKTYPDQELADVALENALRFGISVYDGLYLALAEIYVAPLVTADEILLKACEGRFDFIESLQDFSPD